VSLVESLIGHRDELVREREAAAANFESEKASLHQQLETLQQKIPNLLSSLAEEQDKNDDLRGEYDEVKK
jgi:peptidoglycan hydrolase CwlO-like protein